MLGVDGVGDRRCLAILARNCSVENWERSEERKRSIQERDGIHTVELNRRDQVTAPRSWPSFGRKTGAKVDYQVAAPTVLGTPTMHRAKIAQPRVRMEGWRQRRPGSNAKESTGRKKKAERKNILTRKKKKNILDTHRPSHGRPLGRFLGYGLLHQALTLARTLLRK